MTRDYSKHGEAISINKYDLMQQWRYGMIIATIEDVTYG